MKKASVFLTVFFASIVLLSCSASQDTIKLTVASEKRMASAGAGTMEVYLVKKGDAVDWTYFYNEIEGFNYEAGYEYVLNVKEEKVEEPIPADASSLKYTLIKEVSKTQKTSDNLPQ